MKRGEIYFNKYTDSTGKLRKIPVVVMSKDDYNAQSDFATCVRMVREVNGAARPTHVPIPKEAMKITDDMVALTNGTALAETIGSVRKTNLVGPVGYMDSEEVMQKVAEAITDHVGAGWEGKTKKKEPEVMTSADRPTKDCPWYSPQVEKEQKITEPSYGYNGTGMVTDAGSKRFGPGAEGEDGTHSRF